MKSKTYKVVVSEPRDGVCGSIERVYLVLATTRDSARKKALKLTGWPIWHPDLEVLRVHEITE